MHHHIIFWYLFYFPFSEGENSRGVFELCVSAHVGLNEKVN